VAVVDDTDYLHEDEAHLVRVRIRLG